MNLQPPVKPNMVFRIYGSFMKFQQPQTAASICSTPRTRVTCVASKNMAWHGIPPFELQFFALKVCLCVGQESTFWRRAADALLRGRRRTHEHFAVTLCVLLAAYFSFLQHPATESAHCKNALLVKPLHCISKFLVLANVSIFHSKCNQTAT